MTLDSFSQARLEIIYPDIRVRILRVYNDMFSLYGLQMKCAQGLRSVKEQNDLYAQGRSKPGKIVTWAQGGKSFHNYGCAVDSAFMGPDPYLEQSIKKSEFMFAEYGRLAKAHGLFWGGDFPGKKKDLPHVELTYGLSLSDIRALYKFGGVPSVWAKFDQIRGIPEESEWKEVKQKLLAF